MRRLLAVITVLLIAAFAVSMFAGCSKAQKGVSGTTSPSNPTKSTPAVSSNPVAQILAKQKAVVSYIQIMEVSGQTIRNKVKFQNGKPIRARVDMGDQGMMLVQYDKKVQYIVDPKTNTAMAMPATSPTLGDGTSGGQSSVPAMSDAEKMKYMRGVPETLDGVDCWKVTRTDSDVVFWSEKENGLPVQVKVQGKEGVQLIKLKYEQINSVPDSEFELPAGVKVQQMPKGQMPGGR